MFSKACEYNIKAAAFTAVESQQFYRFGSDEIPIEFNSLIDCISGLFRYFTKNFIVSFVNTIVNKSIVVYHLFKLLSTDFIQILETTSLLGCSNDVNIGIIFLRR